MSSPRRKRPLRRAVFVLPSAFTLGNLFFQTGEWSWVVCFLFAAAVALRLARFNVEQAGRAKHHFLGLPSPAAGGTIATFHAFSQTAFFQQSLAGWPWPRLVAVMILGLSALMLGHVPYPALRPGLRRSSDRVALAAILTIGPLLLWKTALLAFPVLVGYVVFGPARAIVLGLLERFPGREVMEELEQPVEGELSEAGSDAEAAEGDTATSSRWPPSRRTSGRRARSHD